MCREASKTSMGCRGARRGWRLSRNLQDEKQFTKQRMGGRILWRTEDTDKGRSQKSPEHGRVGDSLVRLEVSWGPGGWSRGGMSAE